MSSTLQLEKFMNALKYTPNGPLFNPWYTTDRKHDIDHKGQNIRREQLYTYFSDRLESARYICVGEALGYQGGHFTGIAMTSERILLGYQEAKHGIPADIVFRDQTPRRTSRPDIVQEGFSEPTATIMWKALLELEIDPFEVVLWNALPWHPYDPDESMLTNRTPTAEEFEKGMSILEQFLELFGDRHIIAVGRKSEQYLQKFPIPFKQVRHPAHGGAPKFRRQMQKISASP